MNRRKHGGGKQGGDDRKEMGEMVVDAEERGGMVVDAEERGVRIGWGS